MKLKVYNVSNAMSHGRDTKPTISFSEKGLISFNKAAVAALNLKVDDQVEIAQDEQEPNDWYFKITKAENESLGFKLKSYKEGDGRLSFNSSTTSRDLLYGLEPVRAKATMLISLESDEFGWNSIITASVK